MARIHRLRFPAAAWHASAAHSQNTTRGKGQTQLELRKGKDVSFLRP